MADDKNVKTATPEMEAAAEKVLKDVEAKAAEIMQTGVKFKDACHVASAVYAKCEYFISTDKRLLKYKSEAIKMVSPIEFIIEMEETLYDGKHD